MPKIQEDIKGFIQALSSSTALVCNQQGDWKPQHWLGRMISHLFSRENDSILDAFINCFYDLEKKPIAFYDEASILESQRQEYQDWITAAKLLSRIKGNSTSKTTQEKVNLLKAEIIKLRYRIGRDNGGLDPLVPPFERNETLFNEIKTEAHKWKQAQKLYPKEQQDLTDEDLSKIYALSCYPKYMKRLLQSKKQRDLFFKFALRDNIGISELCRYTQEINNLYSCHMIGRIGAFSRQMLGINIEQRIEDGQYKVYQSLTLLIENQKVNILDKSQLFTFSNGKTVSLSDIFKDFSNKNLCPGDYEFFFDGIRPWNGHEWGEKKLNEETYQTVDSLQDHYWDQFPLFDLITQDKLEKRYQIEIQDERQWVGIIESSRQCPTRDLDNAHGYMLLYIPLPNRKAHNPYRAGKADMKEQKVYKVIPIGMFATHFPNSCWEKLTFVASTVKGIPVFPDPNYFYSHRQKASYPVLLSEEEGIKIFKEIGIKKAEGGIFQWSWENCSYFAQNTFAKVLNEKELRIPMIFKKHFKKCEPQGFIGIIHWVYLKTFIFNWLRRAFEEFMHWLLGSRRTCKGIEYGIPFEKSAYSSPFGQKSWVNLPAAGHQRILKEKFGQGIGVVTYGHQLDQFYRKYNLNKS